jgi:hypothetical protein
VKEAVPDAVIELTAVHIWEEAAMGYEEVPKNRL